MKNNCSKKYAKLIICIIVLTVALLPSVTSAASWSGAGGKSSLDYLSGARSFSWSVNPATKRSYTFTGTITIKSVKKTGNYGTLYISGGGKGRISNVKYISKSIKKKLKKGTTYYAAYSGTCIDSKGYTYNITKGAGIPFTYR